MDSVYKLKCTIDALFGTGVSRQLPKKIEITYSKKNGRIKNVFYDAKLLCTLRIDGGLAITPYFAQILLKSKKFAENCIEVDEESKPFIEEGKSVFCKHVTKCGKNVQISSDTAIVYKNKVIAVGKAILSADVIPFMKRGVAVKIRDSLKNNETGVKTP